jgi:hypothetical protein
LPRLTWSPISSPTQRAIFLSRAPSLLLFDPPAASHPSFDPLTFLYLRQSFPLVNSLSPLTLHIFRPLYPFPACPLALFPIPKKIFPSHRYLPLNPKILPIASARPSPMAVDQGHLLDPPNVSSGKPSPHPQLRSIASLKPKPRSSSMRPAGLHDALPPFNQRRIHPSSSSPLHRTARTAMSASRALLLWTFSAHRPVHPIDPFLRHLNTFYPPLTPEYSFHRYHDTAYPPNVRHRREETLPKSELPTSILGLGGRTYKREATN